MEGRQDVGVIASEFPERANLVLQDGEDENGVEFGVAGVSTLQPAVLIVLDQVVIGVAGERKRVQPERVDRRFRQKPQAGTCFFQVEQIVLDDVVTEHELRAIGVIVERAQRACEVAAAIDTRVRYPRMDGGEASYFAGVRVDFEVDRDAS